MPEQKIPEPLLVCGLVAGPLYVAVTAIEAMTRAGFDPRKHRYNLLTTGDYGWIHRANYIVAGMLIILFAIGVRRMLREGRIQFWVPLLFVLYGVAYISSGVFPADPVIGFPPGTRGSGCGFRGRFRSPWPRMPSSASPERTPPRSTWPSLCPAS